MTTRDDKHIIGVYPDLTAEAGGEFATDVLETIRYEELLGQGYQVVGTIDKDTTDEEVKRIAERIAEKRVPPADNPVWDRLAEYAYEHFSPRNKVLASLGKESGEAFVKELEAHIADGGDEDEFCLTRLREIEEGWRSNA